MTDYVDGQDDPDAEPNGDVDPVVVAESVAGESTQQGHHDESEPDEQTQYPSLVSRTQHVVYVHLFQHSNQVCSILRKRI